MTYNFFATLSRMKYIERWALMRSTRPENLSEHSLEVAMIAHALCTIGNVRYARDLDADRAALIGLYHDASEIITGDMPTPVKYYNNDIRSAYKNIESIAEERLLDRLPDDLRPTYEQIFRAESQMQPDTAGMTEEEQAAYRAECEKDTYMRRLVKAADKISAYLKCIEEEGAGNGEFRTAKETNWKSVHDLTEEYPEVSDFVRDFLPAYGKTLDELSVRKDRTGRKF